MIFDQVTIEINIGAHHLIGGEMFPVPILGSSPHLSSLFGMLPKVLHCLAQCDRMMLAAQLFNAPEIDRAGPAVSAEDNIALVEQKLGQVSAVLPGYSGNKCNLGIHNL